MTRMMKCMISAVNISILLCSICFADELILERGKKLEGRITKVSNNELTFVVGTNEYIINVRTIRAISTDSGDPDMQTMVKDLQDKIEAVNKIKKGRQLAVGHKELAVKRVDFYMRVGCPWCSKMENFLILKKIPYNRYDIERDANARRRMHDRGGDGVPFIIVDNKRVVSGYAPDGLMKALKE